MRHRPVGLGRGKRGEPAGVPSEPSASEAAERGMVAFGGRTYSPCTSYLNKNVGKVRIDTDVMVEDLGVLGCFTKGQAVKAIFTELHHIQDQRSSPLGMKSNPDDRSAMLQETFKLQHTQMLCFCHTLLQKTPHCSIHVRGYKPASSSYVANLSLGIGVITQRLRQVHRDVWFSRWLCKMQDAVQSVHHVQAWHRDERQHRELACSRTARSNRTTSRSQRKEVDRPVP